MKRILCCISLLLISGSLLLNTTGAQEIAPTLIPPTLVPTAASMVSDVLISESAIARMQRDSKLRVGILFNAPPFGELNIRGEVSGFDAEIIKSMAEAWGVSYEFIQVTRQNAISLLLSGQVDLLTATQVHFRALDSLVEFSQTYYRSNQSMMIRSSDSASRLADMANRRIGVVVGTASEQALFDWLNAHNLNAAVQTYYTLDRAYVALINGEVDGVVDNRVRLIRAATQPDLITVLDEAVSPEPYAMVMLRQDVNFRNLVNQTLQYLVQSGRMDELHKTFFSGSSYPVETMPLWANIGAEAPKPTQYSAEITYPQYVTPRILSDKVLRVAGVSTVPEDAPESQRRLEQLNRILIEQIASRWGVSVQYIPDSVANAVELVANGQADLAVGIQPDWAVSDRVDFSGVYLLHGERLMVPSKSDIQSFIQLRGGRWVAVANNEPGMRARVLELGNSVNARVQVYETREQDLASAILLEKNADVAFGDSLKLIPHVQANPNDLKLTQRQPDSWYTRAYVAIALPRNDIDFRLLVDYTLQELAKEEVLNTLLLPVMLPDEIPQFEIWPGSSHYLGLALGRN